MNLTHTPLSHILPPASQPVSQGRRSGDWDHVAMARQAWMGRPAPDPVAKLEAIRERCRPWGDPRRDGKEKQNHGF